MSVRIETLGGTPAEVRTEDVEALRAGLRGALCQAGEPGYEEARTLWNAMIDRRPGLVVRAAGAADVLRAVAFARERDLLLAVRGGGHNIGGNAVCDGGLLIDLSRMKSVRVDPAARRARVEPGVTLGELDRETQAFALALPTGINSTTGVAGLTLGGGFGWLTRRYGMTVDNLISADVVTADGHLITASDKEHDDLFWALRGGGGNFGVVTSFEFALHPVGPEVLSGLLVHPLDEAREILQGYREAVADAPDDLTCWAVMRKAPPLPFIPGEWHGREVLILALCYCGMGAEAERAVAPLRALGHPIADAVGPHPFVGWQAAFDPLLTPGARNYWKSNDFLELSDGAIDAMLDGVRRLPSPECEVFIAQVGGAMSRVAPDATAYPQRSSHFIMNAHTRWREPGDDRRCIDWARELFRATTPHAAGSAYVNFVPGDEADVVEKAYGANYARLAEIKARFDPDNRFRVNHNIAPRSAATAR